MELARIALALALTAVACSAPPLATGVRDTASDADFETTISPYTVGPNDNLRVVVFGHPELSTNPLGERVDFQGRINLPLVGPVPVAGLEPDAARDAIRVQLEAYLREPRVTVSVLEYTGRLFYLFGEVARPGAYPLDRPLTALQALSAGGGLKSGADREQIAVLRGGHDDLEVFFFNGATPGPDGMFPLRPNDFVFVRQSAAGTFRDQVLPVVQSLVPPITALASLVIAADTLND